MRALDLRLAAALAVVLACGEGTSPPAAAPPSPQSAPVAPAPAMPPGEQAVAPSPPDAATPATTVKPSGPRPAASAAPANTVAPAKPAAAQASAAAPVAAPATAPAATPQPLPPSAHAKVGDAKCKMCHRAQHQSWSESAHAQKGLDCEACHGNGGDYWPSAVMRDRARAVAAGLVMPGVDRCKGCHASADAALLARAHGAR